MTSLRIQGHVHMELSQLESNQVWHFHSICPTNYICTEWIWNFALVVKQDLDKLLVIRFIESMDQFTWLSPIVVVPNMNIKLEICIDFRKLNLTTIFILFHLLKSIGCNNMPWNLLLLDGFLGYHHIMIILENMYKTTFITNLWTFV